MGQERVPWAPSAYKQVARRVRGLNGKIRDAG
jgi:hypothetical protein